ncbi:nephrin-like [Eriocheir sinensis]|uniref:nephrin-like n=1 Tax=Eriocheir sinensis TaxID=95602 RepID=UPI0021C9B4AE|nr:nephrin-like [Eriocheir sinensis]
MFLTITPLSSHYNHTKHNTKSQTHHHHTTNLISSPSCPPLPSSETHRCLLSSPGAAGQSQAFRERPDSVQVRAGSDVFLRCAVDHQQGKAQWTKDGFALGFERNVPGYPRYQYSGEAALGEHHLIIKGITLEDDGEYQCQVGPTANALPIWAAANVTVMVPPGSIRVAGRREGEMVVVAEGEDVQLECVVGDARPEPSLAWYRDGLRVDESEYTLQTDVRRPSTRRRLVSVTSRLTVRATREDDGTQYTCRASHPALQHPALPLAASLTLSVLHPPDPPSITGYRTGEVLRAGERRTLTCRVVGGNPGPWVTWYWHQVLPNNTLRTQARKSVHLNDKTSGDLRSRGVSVTQQVTASRTDDGAVYECRVTSDQLSRPLSANVTLTVHYEPAQVRVSGPTVVTAGQRFTLTCITSAANPPANLTWILDGEQVNTTKNIVTRDDGGGWVTSSELSSEAGRASGVRMVRARCEAQHLEATDVITHTRNITVMRPPGQPVVELKAQRQVVAGSLVEFTCITKGGHPPPKVRLYKNDKELLGQTAVRSGVTAVTATMTAAAEDNGARLKCDASNAALPDPLTAVTTLNMLFPAWEVRGWANPRSVEVGKVITLTCESSSSIPASTITWPSDANAIAEPSSRKSPGSFGGQITRSEMRVRVTAEDQGRVVTCEADNGLGVTVATNITLDVLRECV